MLKLPSHMQSDYDALSPAQKDAFTKIVTMGAAGGPGNMIITDASFEHALKSVKLMGESPDVPVEPDKTVNHDWNFKFK